MPEGCLESALKYRELGFSIIPVGKDKKPLIKWEEFQKRIASKEELTHLPQLLLEFHKKRR